MGKEAIKIRSDHGSRDVGTYLDIFSSLDHWEAERTIKIGMAIKQGEKKLF